METEDPTMFADLLRRSRLVAGLTQEALAERACVSRKAVSALECGARVSPRRDTVRLLADALGLAPLERAALAAAATTRPRAVPSVPPARTATHPTPPTNLPAPPTPLIGRADDLARACALLRESGVRLLTLTGPAGVGKTRLALNVAADLLPDFADGVFLVSLAPLSDPTLVASAIARTLGLREQGNRPLQDILAEHLGDRRLLLLLDNFEHVTAAAPLLAELLAACPHLGLLVTSRAPVHVRGEQLLPVAPLAVPDLTHLPPREELAQVAAVTLFVARARAVAPDFALTPANAPVVAAICARLDGLPLAIELAAARVTLLPPSALLARLEYRLPLLVGGARDLPERQQTLRAAIAWSYDLLHAGERALFRRLAVFAGGATLEAIEAICPTSPDLEGDVLEWLAALVDQNLLRREAGDLAEQGESGEPRMGMLETIRAYGREQLATSGETEATERAHAEYYLALAERAESELKGSELAVWLARLEREHNNLRAALGWARKRGEVALGLRLAGALGRFWYMRGHLHEGGTWLEGLLASDEPDDRATATPGRMKSLSAAGNLALERRDYSRARALWGESLALCRNLGDQRGIVSALRQLGRVAADQGDYGRAIVLNEESATLARTVEARWDLGAALNNLAGIALDQGDFERAVVLQEEIRAFTPELGDPWATAVSLHNLGEALFYQGDFERAVALQEQSLTLFREMGAPAGVADSLRVLGNVAREQGNFGRARDLYAESLALYLEAHDDGYIADCLESMAKIASARSQPQQAVRLLGTVETLRAAVGAPLPPRERIAQDRLVVAMRAAIGADAFAAAWAAGGALSLEQAIALALEQ